SARAESDATPETPPDLRLAAPVLGGVVAASLMVRVDAAQAGVRFPRGQPEPSAAPADTPELARGRLGVRREDDAEARADDVEAAVVERQRLCVPLDPVDRQRLAGRLHPRLLEQQRS